MKKTSICPNCKEEVEIGWDMCWNCQTPIIIENIEEEVELQSSISNKEIEYVKVDRKRIVYAGKQIKYAVKLLIVFVLVGLLSTFIVLIMETPKVFYIAIIINTFLLIMILVSMFQAGTDIEKSVPPQNIKQ